MSDRGPCRLPVAGEGEFQSFGRFHVKVGMDLANAAPSEGGLGPVIQRVKPVSQPAFVVLADVRHFHVRLAGLNDAADTRPPLGMAFEGMPDFRVHELYTCYRPGLGGIEERFTARRCFFCGNSLKGWGIRSADDYATRENGSPGEKRLRTRLAAGSHNQTILYLHSVFQLLRKKGVVAKNPFADIPLREFEAIFRKPPFTVEELALLEKTAKAHPSFIRSLLPACVLRSGCPRRDVPREFGPWSSVYTRWRHWCESGLWARMLTLLARGAVGELRHLDCSHIKLHPHGANPPGGQTAQAIGRTKSGLNTKLAAIVDSRGRVVAVSLAPGPRHDLKTIAPLVPALDGKRAVGNKGFDVDTFRASLHAPTCGRASRRAATGGVRCAFIAVTTATAITSKTASVGSNASAASARVTTSSRTSFSRSSSLPPPWTGTFMGFENTPSVDRIRPRVGLDRLKSTSRLIISLKCEIVAGMTSRIAERKLVPRREAAVFKALGHAARLQIVTELAEGERCVCDLVDLTGLGWSTVSRHLSVLKGVGVIEDEKRGLQVFYRLKLPCVARFAACLRTASAGQDVRFTLSACCGEPAS